MLPLTRSRNRARFFGTPFSPEALFAGGTVAGAWYDPSDLSTLFTTSAGTTPVAMPGQGSAVSVGRMLDKSGNGNHAIAFNDTTARPELRARVNLLVATATLSTQSVTTQATSYTLRFAGAGSITLSGTATGSYSAGTHTITCTAGTLTLTVSGTVTTADLRPANSGALLPAYQAVVDANTYDTSGFPLYLFFDGVDDSMYTPANLDLSGTDKVAVFAGVRIAAGTGSQNVCEFSNNAFTTNGGFSVAQGPNVASSGFGFLMNAGSGIAGQTADKSVPYSSAITETFDSAQSGLTNEVKLRMNGVAQTFTSTSGTDSGSGNFGSHILNIGVRGATVAPTAYLNGHIHSLIIAGSAVSAGNISATEQWVAGKTGIVI